MRDLCPAARQTHLSPPLNPRRRLQPPDLSSPIPSGGSRRPRIHQAARCGRLLLPSSASRRPRIHPAARRGRPLLSSGASREEEQEMLNAAGESNGSKEKKERKKGDDKKGKMRRVPFDDGSKRGVCYLSRIPPRMDPASLRHMLLQYGEIERIYLAPTDPSTAQATRKRPGSSKGHAFSEGWVEFPRKSVAKRVASMLNGEQIGGRRRSSLYYDIWNIKYLSKFKWDDLTEEISYKSAIREQKLALEISAAKRERNYTISKFAQSRAINSIKERLEKKRKTEDSESSGKVIVDQWEAKIFRRFPQNKPVDSTNQKKGTLPEDILAEVFGNSSSERVSIHQDH